MDVTQLSENAAQAVAVAMATDAWNQVRSLCAKMFSNSNKPEGSPLELLDQYNKTVDATPEKSRDAIRETLIESVIVPLIRDAIENDPNAQKVAEELRNSANANPTIQALNVKGDIKPGRDFNSSGRDNIIINRGKDW